MPETAEVPAELDTPRSARRRKLFLGLGGGLALIASAAWLLVDTDHVSTENAYVNAETAQVTPLVAAPVAMVAVANTQAVKRGDVLLRLDDTDARLALARALLHEPRRRTGVPPPVGSNFFDRIRRSGGDGLAGDLLASPERR